MGKTNVATVVKRCIRSFMGVFGVVSLREQFERKNAWGIATSVDIYDCNPDTIRDADKIRQFVFELCDLIDMKRFGECEIINFGEDERVAGYSLKQFIETSLVSGHFANASNAVYLDIFSCKFYEPEVAAKFATEFFEGKSHIKNVTIRE